MNIVRFVLPILIAAVGAATPVFAQSLDVRTTRAEGSEIPLSQMPSIGAATVWFRTFPGCGPTLQSCISASSDGDTVFISPGTYLTTSLAITQAVSLIGTGATPRDVTLHPIAGRMIQYDAPTMITTSAVISNLMIENGNGGSSSGGAIRVSSGGIPVFQSVVISNNIASGGGGVRIIPTLPVTMINVTVFSNTSTFDGGGLDVSGGLTLLNSRVTSNKANNGAGIYSHGPMTVTLSSSNNSSLTLISSNVAVTHGGGVFAEGNVALIGNVTFNANQATKGDGGGMYANNISDATGGFFNTLIGIDSNSAFINGGGIRALGTVVLDSFPELVGNHTLSTTGDGGAIYADGDVTLAGGLSQANGAHDGGIVYTGGNGVIRQHASSQSNARQDGGCIYAVGNLDVTNDEFVLCSAGRNGGAFFAGKTVTITGSYNGPILQQPGYQQNVAARGGLVYGSRVIVRSVTPISNTASIEGGAVYATASADISGTTFTSNTSGFAGGAVLVTGTAWITGSIFGANQVTNAVGFGGGVWVTGTLTLSNTDFLSNTTTAGFQARGGAAGASGSIKIAGGSFKRNKSTVGGGVFGLKDVTASGSTFIQNSASVSGGAVIATQVFITNSLFTTNTSNTEGGAVWTVGGVISNTKFDGNGTGCCSSHAGGALFVRGTILINRSEFTNNESDHGGALFLQGSSTEIRDSTFTNNLVSCCGGGGAIDAQGFGLAVYGSTFTGNVMACCEDGGAIRASNPIFVERSRFENNAVQFGSGGAIFMQGGGLNATITATSFISNFANQGGGALVLRDADIENSAFLSNHVSSAGNGGAMIASSSGFFISTTFSGNHVDAVPAGCGTGLGGSVFGAALSSLNVSRSAFDHGSAPRGGAIFAAGVANIDTSRFSDNSAFCPDSVTLANIGSGGAIDSRNSLTVKRSLFTHNSAGSIGGGAIAHLPSVASSLRVENSLFARNLATNTVSGARGAAIVISGTAPAQLFYNTFANQSAATVSAITVVSGSTTIVNNVVAGFSTGVERISSPVFEDFNLYFGNTANINGTVTSGGSSLVGDPKFINAAADNFHIGSGSAALNKASDIAITTDVDGDTRPQHGGFDIGFDEQTTVTVLKKVFLATVVR